MNALKTLALMLAAAVSVAACATTSRTAGTGTEILNGEDERSVVKVENRNWSDVTVYAVTGGLRQRLGSVSSMGSASFRVPTHLLAGSRDLRLLIDPIGGGQEYLSPAVPVYGGQEVSFHVQNQISLSSIAVFNRRR